MTANFNVKIEKKLLPNPRIFAARFWHEQSTKSAIKIPKPEPNNYS